MKWQAQRWSTKPGIYTGGTLAPGARWSPVTWKDNAGNFWMFGGFGYDKNGTVGFLNDLWEFTGGHWVWVSSAIATSNVINQNGVYGTQGTPAAANTPGSRQTAVGWTDATGNLWLFGGEGLDSAGTPNGILNDLWEYSTDHQSVGLGRRIQHRKPDRQLRFGPGDWSGKHRHCRRHRWPNANCRSFPGFALGRKRLGSITLAIFGCSAGGARIPLAPTATVTSTTCGLMSPAPHSGKRALGAG